MTHEQIIWQGITALVTILVIVAGNMRAHTDRKRYHADTSSKLDTPSGDPIGEVAERTHDLAALAAVHPEQVASPALQRVVERVNSDLKSPVQVNGKGIVEGKQ